MAQAARLGARFPDPQIILNHAGSPIDRDAAGMAAWRPGLALLAAEPNVAIKISDLVAYDHHWTVDSLRPVVLACIDAFGADRAMFGSDFPVAGLHATYDQAYDAFKAIVADFSAAEQRKLFHDNAARLYRLAVSPRRPVSRSTPRPTCSPRRRAAPAPPAAPPPNRRWPP